MTELTGVSAESVRDSCVFTFDEYERLLDIARERYAFVDYDTATSGRFVFWRHDIDYSPQRALAMAKAEANRGLQCIYHVLLSGRYYNIFEAEIGAVLREIVALGHHVGLHFDMDVFGTGVASETEIERRVVLERDVLTSVLETSVTSVSFHNYVLNRERLVEPEYLGGMLNMIQLQLLYFLFCNLSFCYFRRQQYHFLKKEHLYL